MRRWAGVLTLLGALLAAACTRPPAPAEPRTSAPPLPSGLPTRPPPSAPAVADQPVVDPIYPAYGNAAIDVRHYDLALDWQPATRVLTGTATLSIRVVTPVREITVDFGSAYSVDDATLDGARVSPARRAGDGDLMLPAGRELPAGAEVSARILYRGTPREGPFPGIRRDVPSSGVRLGRDGAVWALHEPYGAYTWFPCNDHPSDKALFDVSITVPPGWAGVSSGRFGGVVGDTYRWHGDSPSATYVVAFAVDRYRRVDAVGPRGLPVTYWVRPDQAGEMLPVLERTPTMIEWLERRFGPYPFSSAGAVVVPDMSAMETQAMVSIGPLTGRRGESVLLHELAHQWFGDSVSPRTWRDVWLNEGFATYVELLYASERWGADLGQALRRMHRADPVDRRSAGPPANYKPNLFGEHNVYYGPALMLHELRLRLGDPLFFAVAHDWAQHHRHTIQDRASFTAWLAAYTGRQDLTAIVDKWLDSPTTPPFPA